MATMSLTTNGVPTYRKNSPCTFPHRLPAATASASASASVPASRLSAASRSCVPEMAQQAREAVDPGRAVSYPPWVKRQ